jgi:predicted nucleic acid-binding protein
VQIVVDTNVFINAIGTQSPYRWIVDKVISGELTFCSSNHIFFEYWEILETQTNSKIAENIANFLAVIPSVKLITPFIKWGVNYCRPRR